jgi:hypothetical protein
MTTTVHLGLEPARRFADIAMQEYRKCLGSRDANGVPSHLPRAWALLFGRSDGSRIAISDLEFVPNVRDRDKTVIAEFETTIAARFGDVYRNPGRGFWCDESQVLQAIKRHAENGLDLLGSVHSHPNWHEIGPPRERFQRLSEHPTRMDDYLFRQSGWPVNVIWYVRGEEHRVACWRPGPRHCDRLDIEVPPHSLGG